MRCHLVHRQVFSIIVLVHTRSMTEISTSENGRKTKCMATGFIRGPMERNISENSGTGEIRMEFSILR